MFGVKVREGGELCRIEMRGRKMFFGERERKDSATSLSVQRARSYSRDFEVRRPTVHRNRGSGKIHDLRPAKKKKKGEEKCSRKLNAGRGKAWPAENLEKGLELSSLRNKRGGYMRLKVNRIGLRAAKNTELGSEGR